MRRYMGVRVVLGERPCRAGRGARRSARRAVLAGGVAGDFPVRRELFGNVPSMIAFLSQKTKLNQLSTRQFPWSGQTGIISR
jgi:hypothetical protein